jgi:2,3-bisphosphoglycerate-dependent phosphoglycerate mutase
VTVNIVYETHSLTEDNERGHATGWLPGKLSPDGRRFAAELGRRRRTDVDAVFCSDLGRAVETASIAFAGSDVPVLYDWRLRECDFGELNGAPVADMRAIEHLDVPFPGGESVRQSVLRVSGLLADLPRRWDGHRVLLIGHIATWRALEHYVHGVPVEDLIARPFEWREGWEYRLRPA